MECTYLTVETIGTSCQEFQTQYKKCTKDRNWKRMQLSSHFFLLTIIAMACLTILR